MKTKIIRLSGITKKEQKQLNHLRGLLRYIFDLFATTARVFDMSKYIENNISKRKEGKNEGQWGFIQSPQIDNLILILNRLKIGSFIDLGSGCGILIATVKIYYQHIYNDYIKVAGYEIEDDLVKIGSYYGVIKKDILTLDKDDIKSFGALYFYEPLQSPTLAKEFVENLEPIMYSGQYIIYQPAGSIYKYLNECKSLVYLGNHFGHHIYKKI